MKENYFRKETYNENSWANKLYIPFKNKMMNLNKLHEKN